MCTKNAGGELPGTNVTERKRLLFEKKGGEREKQRVPARNVKNGYEKACRQATLRMKNGNAYARC